VTFVFALANGDTSPRTRCGAFTPELLPDDCPLSRFDGGEVVCWPPWLAVPMSGMFVDFDNWVRIIELKE